MAPLQTNRTDRWLAPGSRAEDAFVALFGQLFGPDKAQQLLPQFEFRDIHGRTRFIDFALETVAGNFAFEIDGIQWHHPAATALTEYEDHLVRQNSLVHHSWLVLRWTDRQVVWTPKAVKDELALYLERVPRFLGNDDFLPAQQGAVLEVREHQEEALADLERLRFEGKSIALLTHATGTGKTVTAILDAMRLGGRTLYVAHTDNLVRQTARQFQRLWPQQPCGLFLNSSEDHEASSLVASIQKLSRNLGAFRPDHFDYIIVDEAHRASAPSYQKLLSYFCPRFVLGLTATPERADGIHVLEVFQNTAHRLSLEEAIRQGQLAPVRCVRVKTNVDLSKVRFNAANYYAKDLETTIRVPSRDRLIVETYLEYVKGKRAVCFSVNVEHGEALAGIFRENGIAAAVVSGRVSAQDREDAYSRFRAGDIKVLCACDVLNEGWDCPEVEVLLMARPTLSKVLYMQQLGRGTRKSPGKTELIVFDFIDNVGRYSMPQSVHRVFHKTEYRPGALVAGTDAAMQEDAERFARGESGLETLGIEIWSKGVEEIDIFIWQEIRQDMWSASELEVELGAGSRLITNAAQRGRVRPDHTVPVGDRTVFFFAKRRKEEIRELLGLPKITAETIKGLFFDFLSEMDMSSSYKPVFMKAFIENANKDGKVAVRTLAKAFRAFYVQRDTEGLLIEKYGMRMSVVHELNDEEVQTVMLQMPFEKFERRKFIRYDRDFAYLAFNPMLWKQLGDRDKQEVLDLCQKGIETYYDRIR